MLSVKMDFVEDHATILNLQDVNSNHLMLVDTELVRHIRLNVYYTTTVITTHLIYAQT